MGFINFLIVLSILVFIHELGHFSVARLLGVKVYVFSIGFGKKLISKQWKGTEWTFALIPLGGYVKMKGQEDLNPALANNDSDSYNDDLPYWEQRGKKRQLIVPYTLDNNDMRFATNQGFNTGDHFFNYLKDSFDTLYEEGKISPKMMSVGLHCRLIGRPGRIQ